MDSKSDPQLHRQQQSTQLAPSLSSCAAAPSHSASRKRSMMSLEKKRFVTGSSSSSSSSSNNNTSFGQEEEHLAASSKRRKLNTMAETTSDDTAAAASSLTPSATTASMQQLHQPIQKEDEIMSLRKLIPPRDCPRIQKRPSLRGVGVRGHKQHHTTSTTTEGGVEDTSIWSAVIDRARSHPHEAAESYFGFTSSSASTTTGSSSSTRNTTTASTTGSTCNSTTTSNKKDQDSDNKTQESDILSYTPLHAMLKYNPPMEAVEAVLRAYPQAATVETFEGTPLKIAAEYGVSSILVLRLLLVAELAMRRRNIMAVEQRQQQVNQDKETDDAPNQQIMGYYNPISWITNHRIPIKTCAMLLKWYPVGAFQQHHIGSNNNDSYNDDNSDCDIISSPLIDIVDEFARDHHYIDDENDGEHEDGGYCYDSEESDYYNDDDDEQPMEAAAAHEATNQQQNQLQQKQQKRAQQCSSSRSSWRDRRWEKFLHILYATDLVLQSTTASQKGRSRRRCEVSMDNETNAAAAATATSTEEQDQTNSIPTNTATASSTTTKKSSTTNSTKSSTTTIFHPVHAWVRCLTIPSLNLHLCRPYGYWTVLQEMYHRIPNEFTLKDYTTTTFIPPPRSDNTDKDDTLKGDISNNGSNSSGIDDGNGGDGSDNDNEGGCTVFQTLAESKAANCKLRKEEIRDIVERIMEADLRSAFLPRKSDGRLIGHVALENGWPCRDLFSRKTSATCA